jgi:DNA-binding XRE family transcriptional regulator
MLPVRTPLLVLDGEQSGENSPFAKVFVYLVHRSRKTLPFMEPSEVSEARHISAAGRRVKRYMVSRDLTQQQLADFIGTSRGYLAEIKRGAKDLSSNFPRKLLKSGKWRDAAVSRKNRCAGSGFELAEYHAKQR